MFNKGYAPELLLMEVLTMDNSKTNTKVLYTVKEVAEIMKTNPAFVYSLIKAGLLPALRLGSYKIRHETLMEFFAEHEGEDLRDPKNIRPVCNTTSNAENKPGEIYTTADGRLVGNRFK